MSCTQTLSGISRDCSANNGGVKRVVLFSSAYIDNVAFDDGEDPSVISDVNMKAGFPGVVELQFRRGAAYLTSTEAVSAENGSQYVQNELSMTFHRMDTAKRSAIAKLQFGEYAAIVDDMNGKRWYLGPVFGPTLNLSDEPLVMTGGDGLTGTEWGDRNGYTVVLTNRSEGMPWEYEEDYDPS